MRSIKGGWAVQKMEIIIKNGGNAQTHVYLLHLYIALWEGLYLWAIFRSSQQPATCTRSSRYGKSKKSFSCCQFGQSSSKGRALCFLLLDSQPWTTLSAMFDLVEQLMPAPCAGSSSAFLPARQSFNKDSGKLLFVASKM